jgi:hypothetical protein
MAICEHCKQDMLKVDSCNPHTYSEIKDGPRVEPSREHFDEPAGRCHDCNIVHGNLHHPGCDVERCPKCEGQLLTCECLEWINIKWQP